MDEQVKKRFLVTANRNHQLFHSWMNQNTTEVNLFIYYLHYNTGTFLIINRFPFGMLELLLALKHRAGKPNHSTEAGRKLLFSRVESTVAAAASTDDEGVVKVLLPSPL